MTKAGASDRVNFKDRIVAEWEAAAPGWQARPSADELAEEAASHDVPLLSALAAHTVGSVLLAEGDARSALGALGQAWTGWQLIDAPYQVARTRVLIGLACRALSDEEGAAMDLDASCWVFRQRGAPPDLAAAEALSQPGKAQAPGGLTVRELQVLRLVAAGMTNRAIAGDLFLSEKTVARHVANIFTKLDLNSRSAATAYAYQHQLV